MCTLHLECTDSQCNMKQFLYKLLNNESFKSVNNLRMNSSAIVASLKRSISNLYESREHGREKFRNIFSPSVFPKATI